MRSIVTGIGIAGFVSTALGACTTTAVGNAPCYDGWSQGAEGPSAVVDLEPELRRELETALGDDRLLKCVHRSMANQFIAINFERGSAFSRLTRFATTFVVEDDKTVKIVEEGIIATAN